MGRSSEDAAVPCLGRGAEVRGAALLAGDGRGASLQHQQRRGHGSAQERQGRAELHAAGRRRRTSRVQHHLRAPRRDLRPGRAAEQGRGVQLPAQVLVAVLGRHLPVRRSQGLGWVEVPVLARRRGARDVQHRVPAGESSRTGPCVGGCAQALRVESKAVWRGHRGSGALLDVFGRRPRQVVGGRWVRGRHVDADIGWRNLQRGQPDLQQSEGGTEFCGLVGSCRWNDDRCVAGGCVRGHLLTHPAVRRRKRRHLGHREPQLFDGDKRRWWRADGRRLPRVVVVAQFRTSTCAHAVDALGAFTTQVQINREDGRMPLQVE
mmetsp:Transcript_8146/g.19268  ORF Transcript_8146/g.19268 Transcript_8146/m.19268 type:complete len:320 (+) Transcript_8146:3514-4473(+)